MKFVSLISGGKDSIYNTIECVAMGHELVCVANLAPPVELAVKEMDSYMY
jgi:diphthine-ammonia ligase